MNQDFALTITWHRQTRVTQNRNVLNNRKFITEIISLKVCFVIPFQCEVISACKLSITQWPWEYCMNVCDVNPSSQMSSGGISMLLFHCRWNFIFYMYSTLRSLYLLKVEATLIHLSIWNPGSPVNNRAGLSRYRMWSCQWNFIHTVEVLLRFVNPSVLSTAVCLYDGCKA